MKKNFLFMSVLAALLMAGCSKEDSAPNGGDNGNGEANTSYMAVNLVSSDTAATRAQDGYEDGDPAENKVSKVRFYFFNGLGGKVDVKLQSGNYVNYCDWTPGSGDQSAGTIDGDDIESKLKATIVINTTTGDGIPQRIAAVLNPTQSILDKGSLNLSQLKDIVADYADANLTKGGTFVMFNAVNASNGAQVSTTLIENKNLCKTEADALNNPVTIYVERSVAKVRVTLDNGLGADANNKLALKKKKENETDEEENLFIDGQQVYLQLHGWSLTAETSEGRLVKKINPDWPGTWWNGTHRSFWAINSMTSSNQNRYHNYNSIDTSFGRDHELYTNENAQLNDVDGTIGSAKKRTKVILRGTLCKADGTPLTIVRHLGIYFADAYSETETGNLKKLKESILNQLVASGYTYYFKTDTGRSPIGTDDLKIEIAGQVENEDSKNNCYVYAQLTADAAKKTWYASNDAANTATIGAAVINENLAKKDVVDRALVWKSGMTYYYYEIKHLENMVGVVRNHIYATNVTKIAGLGTPVYDPIKPIYPEKPDPNDHLIAAQINILSWRIVSNDYELEW